MALTAKPDFMYRVFEAILMSKPSFLVSSRDFGDLVPYIHGT